MRIKLLRNKPDHALVEMGDGFQAELAVHFLKVQVTSLSKFECHLAYVGRRWFLFVVCSVIIQSVHVYRLFHIIVYDAMSVLELFEGISSLYLQNCSTIEDGNNVSSFGIVTKLHPLDFSFTGFQ